MKNAIKALAIIFLGLPWLCSTILLAIIVSPIAYPWDLKHDFDVSDAYDLKVEERKVRLAVLEQRRQRANWVFIACSVVFALAFWYCALFL